MAAAVAVVASALDAVSMNGGAVVPNAVRQPPRVGIGYRFEIRDWIVANLSSFDVLEVTIDHHVNGGPRVRDAIAGLKGRVPLVAHGIGLSVGTAIDPDPHYLGAVSGALDELGMPFYSEHLAFTKVPGFDIANLMPLPRTEEVARLVIDNISAVRARISQPLHLENISYLFTWPESTMSEIDFLNLVCRETGARVLLDVENLFLNSHNHGYDPYAFIDALPAGAVGSVHTAGGEEVGEVLIDTHNKCVPEAAMNLLAYLLQRQSPETIILERDRDLKQFDDIMADVRRIREVVKNVRHERGSTEAALTRASG